MKYITCKSNLFYESLEFNVNIIYFILISEIWNILAISYTRRAAKGEHMRTFLKHVSGPEITWGDAAHIGCKKKSKADRVTGKSVQLRCAIPIDPENPAEIPCVNCGQCSLHIFTWH